MTTAITRQLTDTWADALTRRATRRIGRGLAVAAILIGLTWLTVHAAQWAWRTARWHYRVSRVAPWWMASLPLTGADIWWQSRPLAAAAAVAYLAGIGAARYRREDWAERVTQPAQIDAIRRDWRRVAAACQLGHASRLTGDRYPFGRAARSTHSLPRLTGAKHTNSGRTIRLMLRCATGQTVRDITAQSGRLAAAYEARACTVTEDRPGVAIVTLTMHTAPPIDTPAVGPAVPRSLPIGQTSTGGVWTIPTGVHMLCAGVTGAGKGSVMWSGLAELAPSIQAGLVRITGIDLKGGMELEFGRELFTHFATTPEDAVELLAKMATEMDGRAKRMAGKARVHEPTTDDPAWLIVIDELASLTAYIGDRQLKQDAIRSLNLLLTKGRAPGYAVWAFLQDPAKDVLDNRQLFPVRVGMRMAEQTQTAMLFGSGSGVACESIPLDEPGTAYVRDEQGEIQRVRARWTSDKRIRQIARRHTAPAFVPTDPQVVYFIRNKASGAIKIGISNDVARRIQTLQTGSADPLELLGTMPGGHDQESALHAQFADSRQGGEWFAPSPELKAYIKEHAA